MNTPSNNDGSHAYIQVEASIIIVHSNTVISGMRQQSTIIIIMCAHQLQFHDMQDSVGVAIHKI